jgi:putative mRNA 3-end processing factor
VHLTDSVLWFDADRKRELSFISSAHADFIGKHRRILATEQTVRILTRGSGRVDALTSPFRRPFTLGPLQLEMHPAGRMLGAAQLLVTRNDRRILYTSDFLTQRLSTAERARPVPCDVLALPATFGQRHFRFPERDEVLERILSFVDDALEQKAHPVLLVPPMGPAQELMYLLGKRGYRLRAHRSIHDVAKAYIQLGQNLLGAKRLQGTPAKDEVVLAPPILRHDATIRNIAKRRVALISGRALEPGFAFRHRVDAAFPFAEAADHRELLDFVVGCGASEVVLTQSSDETFAEDVRRLGIRCRSLVRPEQLPLFAP